MHYEHELHEHDSWFRHDAADPNHMAAHGETNAGAIVAFMAGTGGAVLIVALVVFYMIFEPLLRAEVVTKHEGVAVNGEYVTLRSEWNQQLSSYNWSDPARGRVSVPLAVAKELVIRESARPQQGAGGR
ncbi:MAG: hypothetical protein SFZ24_02260 [Planctomycetota bacterium]|nr:hypothetical protein [Planctomycetota bacterium]